MCPTFDKHPAWVRSLKFDLSQAPEIIAGDTVIANPVITVTRDDGNAVDLVTSNPGFTANSVHVFLSGGTSGRQYYILAVISLASGATLDACAYISVLDCSPTL